MFIHTLGAVDVWLTCIDRVARDRVTISAASSRPDLPREAQQRSPDGCESADGAIICPRSVGQQSADGAVTCPRSAGRPCSLIHCGGLTCG